MPERASLIVMEEVTDPQEVTAARSRRDRFDRNVRWLETHAAEVYQLHRGRYVCIAGEEIFVADTAPDAAALAQSAHPDDDGRFVRYIPIEKLPAVYADCR